MNKKFCTVTFLLITACSTGRHSNGAFLSKNIYENLRVACIAGNEKDLRYPSGLIFATNVTGPNDTDHCFTSIIISRNWAAVGSRNGFTNKIYFSNKEWQSELLVGLQRHLCTDKTIPAVVERDFNFLILESFVKQMKEIGLHAFVFSDAEFISKKITKIRPLLIDRVQENKIEFAHLRVPTQRQLEILEIVDLKAKNSQD